MNKIVVGLGVALAAQGVLIFSQYAGRQELSQFSSTGPLLSQDPASVRELFIEGGGDSVEGTTVRLRRTDSGAWVLPEKGDMPANQRMIEDLLEDFGSFERGFPVAQTKSARRQLKVKDDTYEKKITLSMGEQAKGGEKVSTLLLGKSPGFKKTYGRLQGELEVYSLPIMVHRLPVQAREWIDRRLQFLDDVPVTGIELPQVSLVKKGEELVVEDLKETERMDTAAREKLVSSLTKILSLSLLKVEDLPETKEVGRVLVQREGEETPVELTLLSFSEKRVVTPIGGATKPEQAEPRMVTTFYLRSSLTPWVSKVSDSIADLFTATTRDSLVVEKVKPKRAVVEPRSDDEATESSVGDREFPVTDADIQS